MMSFSISSSVYPTASRAATLAIGNPVAFEASADDRLTRGFISITTMRPSSGLTANCTFDPPVSTPISRSTATEASRMRWYSLSVRVNTGATVIESPVWIPIGSMFSMLQTIIALSFLSRTTSVSYSFQPSTDSSTSTSDTGEASNPPVMISRNSSALYAIPPPVPPRVNEGRITAGNPTSFSACGISSTVCTATDLGVSNPMLRMASRNASRFSAFSMAARSAPIILTPYFSSTPLSASTMAVLSAVCPPMVGSSASGRSAAITASTNSGVIGSTYTASAVSGSVMMVAGFELIKITR